MLMDSLVGSVRYTQSTDQPSLLLHCSIIKTKGRAMEAVTHFVNDTVEFYKWGLTIAGESSLLFHMFRPNNTFKGVKSTFSCLQTSGWRTGQ